MLVGGGPRGRVVGDYADDAVFITPAGVLRDKDGVRDGFTKLLADVPDAECPDADLRRRRPVHRVEREVGPRVEDGIDTFVFRDGLITVQTVRYTPIT